MTGAQGQCQDEKYKTGIPARKRNTSQRLQCRISVIRNTNWGWHDHVYKEVYHEKWVHAEYIFMSMHKRSWYKLPLVYLSPPRSVPADPILNTWSESCVRSERPSVGPVRSYTAPSSCCRRGLGFIVRKGTHLLRGPLGIFMVKLFWWKGRIWSCSPVPLTLIWCTWREKPQVLHQPGGPGPMWRRPLKKNRTELEPLEILPRHLFSRISKLGNFHSCLGQMPC